ncbi:MAG: sodium ion-translocating decarboxylase subunit beta, partial [Cyclobacteriaceae bacterium]
MELLEKLYRMTAIQNIVDEPKILLMILIAFVLLYLGIKKKYEPLLLVPIAFGILVANFPGGQMSVEKIDESLT